MTNPPHDDRDMSDAVHSWLHENDEPTPDRGRHIGRVMGRVDETRQRRRFWPLDPFGRRATHGAAGTEGAAPAATRRTAALNPIPALTVVALAIVIASALVWVAARSPAQPAPPGGWDVDPADRALFGRFSELWNGPETDLATTREVYAEDAVHTVLWLDDAERISGDYAIWSRMVRAPVVAEGESRAVRLEDDYRGAHRYLVVPTSSSATACIMWVRNDRITRHDCILPMSSDDAELPAFEAATPKAMEEREKLSTALTAALKAADRAALAEIISPDVVHYVQSANQVYTVEGFDDWASQMIPYVPRLFAIVDLPAPEGELRWANVSSISGGALCVFWARDGLIDRQDCVLPGRTSRTDS